MTNPADRSTLEEVHRLFAEDCLKLLRGELTRIYIDKAGEEQTEVLRASAAEMAVIRAFLKDNNITAPAAKGTALEALREKLAKNRKPLAPVDPSKDLPDDLGAFGSPMQ